MPKKSRSRLRESNVEDTSTQLFHPREHKADDLIDHSKISTILEDAEDFFNEDGIETDYIEDVEAEVFDKEDLTYRNKGKSGHVSLEPPTECCSHCKAVMWKQERANKTIINGTPEFSLYFGKGQIKLPSNPPTPHYLLKLYKDPKKSRKYKNQIRLYNTMFSFTSIGGKVDHSIKNGSSPYVYRLNGQNHHLFGSLIPNDGDDPKFCQLYIYNTENEVQNMLLWVDVSNGQTVDTEIVEGLLRMLDETNELVKYFRMARDRFVEQPVQDLKIMMKVCRSVTGRENFIVPSNKVGAIMVGDLEDTCGERDIIVETKSKKLERITDIHPKLISLQYPMLFPNGEDGYHDDIPYVKTANNTGKKRKRITMKEFYSYKL
ncbi:uncharacterized protein LOC108207194 [Daucus carota subsp. sativus]|uniref:uncharacterized protein LOC108207194 n=1 Tax=Daucus carota subsp. sativus TaxID=79200 RepID=UPI0030836DB7